MCQESEQGIWKPVLGALGAASVILTIVGNLVFSPKPSTLPVLKMANTQRVTKDRANTGRANTGRFNTDRANTELSRQAEQARRIEHVPAAASPSQTEETIVTSPHAARQAEAPKSPCESATDVSVADLTPLPELSPQRDETVVNRPDDLPMRADKVGGPVFVAEGAPVIEQAPLPEQAAKAEERVASLPVGSLPVDRPELPNERANDVSVANVRAEPETMTSAANYEPDPWALAVANPQSFVAMQKLSHNERKLLRKIAHLAKKQNRQFKNDRSLVCR